MAEATDQSLKIGILGCRGIPNRYGGYEQFAQHLSEGLVERGHRVWVYQSSLHPYRKKEWKGASLVRRPDPEDKLGTFGQFIYDYYCLRDARKRTFDILLQLGYTSSAIWFFLWPCGPVNMVHMDGLEWKRTKYTAPVRQFLKWMERLAARHGEVLVADSKAIQGHLHRALGVEAEYIPYGAPAEPEYDEVHLARFGLNAGQYYLAIARLVPENNLAAIIEGVLAGGRGLPILVVGDTNSRYGRYLVSRFGHCRPVVFAGPLFEPGVLNSLRHYTRLYFHGHSVGGTNPSLLEAMACGALICAHDNVFNRSVLEREAYYFRDEEDIGRLLADWEQNEVGAADWIRENRRKASMEFNWEKIINSYEALFLSLLKHKKAAI